MNLKNCLNGIPFYVLNNGMQTYILNSEFSGKFILFNNDDDILIKVNSVECKNQEIYLQKRTNYKITVASALKNSGLIFLKISSFEQTESIQAEDQHLMALNVDISEVYTINTNQSSLLIQVLDEDLNALSDCAAIIQVNLLANRDYYILVSYSQLSAIPFALIISVDTQFLLPESQINVNINNQEKYYKIEVTENGQYDINLNEMSNLTISFNIYKLGTDTAISHQAFVGSQTSVFFRTNILQPGVYFIKLSGESNTFSLSYNLYTSQYKWYIDSQEFSGEGIKRGVEHTLELKNSRDERVIKTIGVGQTYTGLIDFISFENGIVRFKIANDAKMYVSAQLSFYCMLFTEGNDECHIEFPVIYQLDDIGMQGISGSYFTNSVQLKFNTFLHFGTNEKVVLYFKYSMDSAPFSSELSIEVTGKSLSLKSVIGYGEKICNLTVRVIRLEFLYSDTGIIKGCVYNKLYSDEINAINIPDVKMNTAFEAGRGIAGDPYIIDDLWQFNNIGKTIKNGIITAHFKCNNINFHGVNQTASFDCEFNGVFDGNGKEISNGRLGTRLSGGSIALFRSIGRSGVIKNIKSFRIYNKVDVLNSANELGFIALENHGLIENCNIVGLTDMSPENIMPSAVGGVVVHNYGTIKNVVFAGDLTGGGTMGTIAAYNEGIIENCSNTADSYISYKIVYSDHDCIGGLVGHQKGANARITNCSSYLKISVRIPVSDSRTLQPYIGGSIGYLESGEESGLIWLDAANFDVGNLKVVTWREWIFMEKKFDQRACIGSYIGYPTKDRLFGE